MILPLSISIVTIGLSPVVSTPFIGEASCVDAAPPFGEPVASDDELEFALPPHPVAISRSAITAIRDTDNRFLADFTSSPPCPLYIPSYHIIWTRRNPLGDNAGFSNFKR
jgi:hypothetical protein